MTTEAEIMELLAALDEEGPLEISLDDSLELSHVLKRVERVCPPSVVQEQTKTLRRLLGKQGEAGRVWIRRKRLFLHPVSEPSPQLI